MSSFSSQEEYLRSIQGFQLRISGGADEEEVRQIILGDSFLHYYCKLNNLLMPRGGYSDYCPRCE